MDRHLLSPRIATRDAATDMGAVKNAVTNFFVEDSGGPSVYQGKDMLAAQRGMKIDGAVFLAALDDAMQAIENGGIGQSEKEELFLSRAVLAIR